MNFAQAQNRLPLVINDFVVAVTEIPPTAAVPTCPGWDAAKLTRHVGTVYRWAAKTLSTRASERLSIDSIDLDYPTGPAGAWTQWLRDSGDIIVEAVEEAEPDTPVWAWGTDQRSDFWPRRMVHETVVHTADAAIAGGDRFEPDPGIAADGIDELLDNLPVLLARPTNPVLDGGVEGTIHLHCTDETADHPGEWTIHAELPAFTWGHDHSKGDVAVRGAAVDLLLAMYGRVGAGDRRFEVFGDEDLWARFAATARL